MKKKKLIVGGIITFLILISISTISIFVAINNQNNEDQSEHHHHPESSIIGLRVIRAEGNIASQNEMDVIYLYISLIGAQELDLKDINLEIHSQSKDDILENASLSFNIINCTIPNSNNYGTTVIYDQFEHWQPTASPPRYIIGEGTMLRLTINIEEVIMSLSPESTIRVEITSPASSKKYIDQWETPPVYPNGGIVKLEG